MNFRITVLALAVVSATSIAQASGIFADNYNMDKSFTDALSSTTMTIAFDGNNYWSTSGGSQTGVRYAQYTSAGSLVNTFSPNLDFRSDFTRTSGGQVFARQYNDNTIYAQGAPGSFTPFVTLGGSGITDAQSAVTFGNFNSEFDAFSSGTLQRWNLAGSPLSSITFAGFGSGSGTENSYPNNRNIAAWGQYYVTFDNGVINGWDATGARVGVANLVGSGTGFDSNFSFSYAADGRFWVVDAAGSTWRGYNVPVPEPASMAVLGLGVLAALRKRRKK